MPRTTSAKKALRGSIAKRGQNLVQGAQLDRLVRAFKKTTEPAAAEISTLQKALDKAAKTGLMHVRKAARIKSRLLKKRTAAVVPTKKSSAKKKTTKSKAKKKK